MSDSNSTASENALFVYFDGLCEPKNPGGVATYGMIVKEDGETIVEHCGLAEAKPWTDEASNNVAEYSAVLHALEWLDKNKKHNAHIILRGDSKLVVNQLQGKYKVKSLRIVELHHKARLLLSKFKNLKIEWIERDQNQDADRLSRIAFKRYTQHNKNRP